MALALLAEASPPLLVPPLLPVVVPETNEKSVSDGTIVLIFPSSHTNHKLLHARLIYRSSLEPCFFAFR